MAATPPPRGGARPIGSVAINLNVKLSCKVDFIAS